jgi:hypothetical protein
MQRIKMNPRMNPLPASFLLRSATLTNRFLLAHLPTPPTQRRVNGVGKTKRWVRSKSKMEYGGGGLGRVVKQILLLLKTGTGTKTKAGNKTK